MTEFHHPFWSSKSKYTMECDSFEELKIFFKDALAEAPLSTAGYAELQEWAYEEISHTMATPNPNHRAFYPEEYLLFSAIIGEYLDNYITRNYEKN